MFSNGLKKVLPFLLLPFATYYLSPEQLGTVQLLNQTATLLTPVVVLGGTWGCKRDYYKLPFEQFRQRWTNAFWLPLLSGLVLTVFCFLGQNLLPLLFDVPAQWWWYIPTAASLWAWWGLGFSSLQVLKKSKLLGILQNASILIEIALVLWGVIYLQMRTEGMLAARLISDILTVIVVFFIVFKYNFFYPKFNLRAFLDDVLKDISLLPLAFLFMLLKFSDRFAVSYFFGPQGAGYYNIVFGLSSALVLLQSSFNLAYTPWLFEQLSKNTPESTQKINLSLLANIAGIILAGAALVLIMPFIFSFIFSPKYAPSLQYLLPTAIIATLFSVGQLLANFYIYHEKVNQLNIQNILLLFLITISAYFGQMYGNMLTMLYAIAGTQGLMLMANIVRIQRFFPLLKSKPIAHNQNN